MANPRCILAVVALALGAADSAALSSFSADYELARGVVTVGAMSRRLTITPDGRYHFESRLAPRGLLALFSADRVLETSSGRLDGTRFVAETYRYDKDGHKRDYALEFDYAANTVRRVDGRRAWSAPLPPQLLDKLNYQAQLMIDLADEPARLAYAIADKDELKQYHIANLGSEEVVTPMGRFATLKLQRERPGSARRTTVWCARELDWMPVKVEFRDKHGAVTTAVLRALRVEQAH